ncbi:TPA: hypothetical protein ACNFCF_002244 [Escherichia coli]|uniref:excisionase n=1 Tax=Escherichia coli TaxID=562 RepID=UPI000DE54B53|nr:excisionase [Escherichia coli]
MTTGGHPPPEYAQKSLYVQQPSLRAGVFMVHQHYGTQTVNRGAVMPGIFPPPVKDGREYLFHESAVKVDLNRPVTGSLLKRIRNGKKAKS